MNSVGKEVQVPNQSVVREPPLRMKHEAVQTVLYQAEDQQTRHCRHQEGERVKGLPGGDAVEEVGHDEAGHQGNVIPLVVREGLEPVGLEQSGRLHEQPVRRIYEFHVGGLVGIPDLRGERLVEIHQSLYFLAEGADGHRVGHDESEGVVKLHLLLDVLQVLVPEEDAPARVMGTERGHIEHVIVVDQQYFFLFLGVASDLLQIFKGQVVGCAHFWEIIIRM